MIQKPIPHKRGSAFKAEITATIAGAVMSLAGMTIKSQMRTKESDYALPGIVVDIVSAGSGRFDILAADTKNWPCSTIVWDIQITDADGNVSATNTIEFICVREVTR